MTTTASEILKDALLLCNDWGKIIIAHESRDMQYTQLERKRASRWDTSPFGCLSRSIPRDPRGAPVDKQLIDLSASFFRAIKDNHHVAAARLLIKIENRGNEIMQALMP